MFDALITYNLERWEFWLGTVEHETYRKYGKTKAQAHALANYFEGRFDAFIAARQMIGE